MAKRRGKDDAHEDGPREGRHPGAYAQVTGSTRRRKSSTKNTKVNLEVTNRRRHRTRDGSKPENRAEDDAVPAAEHSVVAQRRAPVRRKPGPLGMGDAVVHVTNPRSADARETRRDDSRRVQAITDSEPRPAGGSPDTERSERANPPPVQRMQVVEVNDARERRADAADQCAHIMPARARSAEPVSGDGEPLTGYADPAPAFVPAPSPVEPMEDRIEGASVLDARPSLGPESIRTPRGPSWGMLAVAAALSSIIVAAVVVAIREAMHTGQPAGAGVAEQVAPAPAAAGRRESVPPANGTARGVQGDAKGAQAAPGERAAVEIGRASAVDSVVREPPQGATAGTPVSTAPPPQPAAPAAAQPVAPEASDESEKTPSHRTRRTPEWAAPPADDEAAAGERPAVKARAHVEPARAPRENRVLGGSQIAPPGEDPAAGRAQAVDAKLPDNPYGP